VVSHLVQNMRVKNRIPVTYITQDSDCLYARRVDQTIVVKNQHAFVKAVNHCLLKKEYKDLFEQSGVDAQIVEKITQGLIDTPESVVIVSEKTMEQFAFSEWEHIMNITGKQIKTFLGIMILKAACNSQGLYDTGIHPEHGFDFGKGAKNIFIFGENPMGEHPETAELFKSASFVCVQSLFENETTALADLVLPMNFAIEIGGSFTTSFKVVQHFDAVKNCEFGWNDYRFYARLQEVFLGY